MERLINQLFSNWGLLAENFRGERIPLGVGVFLLLGQGLYLMLRSTIWIGLGWGEPVQISSIIFFISMSAVGIIGFVDDRWGRYDIKGLRGHLQYAREHRKLTTGLWKVIIIMLAAMLVSVNIAHPNHWWFVIVILMLSSNLFNLLDVRPGRAGKLFLLMGLLSFFLTGDWYGLFGEWLGLWGVWFLLIIGDLQGKWMLGDAGSNLLGFVTGIWIISLYPFWIQLMLGFVFLWLHWFAEKYSIQRWVEAHHWIRRVDEWGRIR